MKASIDPYVNSVEVPPSTGDHCTHLLFTSCYIAGIEIYERTEARTGQGK